MAADLSLLRTFVEVVRHGSFTETARVLGIAQPTVSLRILRLERNVGVPLIERTTRSAVATEAGEMLFLAASRLLDAAGDVDRVMTDLRHEHRNRLKLASIPLGTAFRAELLEMFTKSSPEIIAEVDEHSHPDILQSLLMGRIDIGFDYNIADPRVETIKLAQLEMGLLIPSSSPLSGRGALTLAHLSNLSVAMFRRDLDPDYHDQIGARLRECGSKLSICPEWTIDGVANFALHRRIATLAVPDLGSTAWPPDGLVFKTVNGLALPWTYCAVRRKAAMRPAVRRFWKFLERAYGGQGASVP